MLLCVVMKKVIVVIGIIYVKCFLDCVDFFGFELMLFLWLNLSMQEELNYYNVFNDNYVICF